MLELLRRVVQDVNAAPDLAGAVDIIVSRIKAGMGLDVCSVYLTEPDTGDYVLRATAGLNPAAVNRVRLGPHEGLVSVVAERAEPLNLDDAPSHPRYRFVAETGEERYHGFLGVPIIRHRQVLGVLVARQARRRRFSEDEVAFLVTLAAQLAAAISHAEVSGGLQATAGHAVRTVRGLPGAPGVAVGTAVVVYRAADLDAVPDRRVEDPAAEEAGFRRAVGEVIEEVAALAAQLEGVLPEEDRALFNAYVMMLRGDTLVERTAERIQAGSWAPAALRDTIAEHARAFDEMSDAYLRERSGDIRDLGRRILVHLQSGGAATRDYPEATVLVGEEVTATQLAAVPPERLAGIVMARGSVFSHVAILARALSVPAVMGAADLPVGRVEGRPVVVDGYRGRVYLDPPASVRDEFTRLAREEAELTEGLEDLRQLPAETLDGHRMPLQANAGLVSHVNQGFERAADGIGLYRTEVPFLVRDRFPGEEDQFKLYREVLASFAPRPVSLRTLDVGGDKVLPYFPIVEDNPFLGWRGVRVTLDHPEIFVTQLRAMVRANEGCGNLQLLFPMITEAREVDECLQLLDRACRELQEEGYTVVRPRTAIMVEVPAAVYRADALARRVDALSVGTNDLTQYLLAVDRNNANVAELFDSLHPAVLQAIVQVVAAGRRQGRPVAVCGEMAGDPLAALLLLGMGVDSLSMNVTSIPRIKWVIRSFERITAQRLLQEVLPFEDAPSVRSRVAEALEEAGLGALLRAGK